MNITQKMAIILGLTAHCAMAAAPANRFTTPNRPTRLLESPLILGKHHHDPAQNSTPRSGYHTPVRLKLFLNSDNLAEHDPVARNLFPEFSSEDEKDTK
ncbi:MAG: hypothetical protein COY39_00435 [Alphaproteobacteria bacterium CG_4_10_14_0_8_um_filter_37_21]|nr:MAG: hypothetical protein COY39_00435 [Alphaproteobacteria bacterium CG_4_10_14_0_8_um_filter_37_21]